MIVGMDFGTTNSGMAVYDGQAIRVLPLDPGAANPRVLRTALYITNEQAVHVGRTAIDRYYEHNIGRVVKTRKVWIGEIEVYAEDLYYVTDAYAWVDVSEPGRLLLSIKSRLREEDHPGAVVGQNFYSLEDLIALYLTVTRVRAEKLLDQEIKEVVLGRPVHFSLDETHDRLAQGRLLQAAFRAGYERVFLQYEPVAAAASYETTISQPQNVLIFDFGGGTLDITVMRLGEPEGRKVLSTGGIPVAGDVFDRKLTRAKLPPHFGEGSYFGTRADPKMAPRWIFDAFSDWQTIIELQTLENRRILEDIARTAQRRYQFEALISLVTSNYGLKMFDEVEKAKRLLSTKRGAEIRLDGPDFNVREFLTRTEFERVIRPDIMAIEEELVRTVADSGLAPAQIDAVVRTGGSAQIPVFYEMLCQKFGREKVQTVDTFSSVTAGLGVLAYGIENDNLSATSYTRDDVLPPPQARGSRPQITQVNLDLMQNRILMEEGVVSSPAGSADSILVTLNTIGELTATTIPSSLFTQSSEIGLAEIGITGPVHKVLRTRLDEQLLVLTSTYRFLLVTPRQILNLQSMGMRVSDLHRLAEKETLCVLGSWTKIRKEERILLASSLGFVRAYPLNVMQESIEAPVPFKLDNPLPGLPVAAFGAQEMDDIVLITGSGRGWRWPMGDLRLTGVQVANCGKEARIVDAALCREKEELTLISEDGYGRRTLSEWIAVPPRPNHKGKSLLARRSALVALAKDKAWVVTDKRLVPLLPAQLPLEDSTRSYPFMKLSKEENVLGAFSDLV